MTNKLFFSSFVITLEFHFFLFQFSACTLGPARAPFWLTFSLYILTQLRQIIHCEYWMCGWLVLAAAMIICWWCIQNINHCGLSTTWMVNGKIMCAGQESLCELSGAVIFFCIAMGVRVAAQKKNEMAQYIWRVATGCSWIFFCWRLSLWRDNFLLCFVASRL